jgi:5-methylcytosine-specific restriction endonuclease McrA/transposase
MKKINIDKEKLRTLYFDDMKSVEDIAKILNCNWQVVSSRMNEYGFKKRFNQGKELKISKEELYDLYWNKQLTTYEIAKKFGSNHHESIRHKLNKFGITLRTKSEASMLNAGTNYKIINGLTRSKLEKLYLKEGLSPNNISKIFGCSKWLISKKLLDFKIRKKTRKEYYDIIKIPKKELVYLYNIKKMTTPKLAKHFNCGKTTILYKMDKYGIKRRSRKEVYKLNIKEYNYPGYVDGRTPLRSIIRGSEEYSNWRKQVFERDNYTCQECFSSGKGNLVAHHINSFSNILDAFLKEFDQFSVFEDKYTLVRLAMKYRPFFEVSNGKTLCEECHFKTDNYGFKSKKENKNELCI